MSTLSAGVSLNGIWSPRAMPVVVHPDATKPSDAYHLAEHTVNTQGIENLSSRPVDVIEREILEQQAGPHTSDLGCLSELKHPKPTKPS